MAHVHCTLLILIYFQYINQLTNQPTNDNFVLLYFSLPSCNTHRYCTASCRNHSSFNGAFFTSYAIHATYKATMTTPTMTFTMSVHNRVVADTKLAKRSDRSSDRAVLSLLAINVHFRLEAVKLEEDSLVHSVCFLCGLLMFGVYVLNYTTKSGIC